MDRLRAEAVAKDLRGNMANWGRYLACDITEI
jgi:hypothetical protein